MLKNSEQVLNNKVYFERSQIQIQHILVPFDDSSYSCTAFEFALDLAKKYGTKISVISIIYNSSFGDINAHQTSIEKTHLVNKAKAFKKMREIAAESKIHLTSELILASSVSDAILTFASSQKADLIVMGTRGKTAGPKHMRLGSVAIDVSQSSSCPVILVK